MNKLYEEDFNLWIEETCKAIQNRDFKNMDWDNLLDEIDDMGKSEKRSLESYLQRLIEHILKLRYWDLEKERNFKHWKSEVVNFRNLIKRLLKRNPSFNQYMKDVYQELFQDAIAKSKVEFEIPSNSFVELEIIMSDDYFG
jgi:predicted unusual protein kinase regulating ubiquinone biosynthesis (AarF/ABC1/UbiB family)